MTGSLIDVSINGLTAEIALQNPPLNLVTVELLHDLHQAVRGLAREPELRSVIVHAGSARAFCAGSDVKEFASIADEAIERKILLEDHVLRLLAQLPVPTIAAIQGAALGGGLELALACDLRIAHADATLGLTESRIGGLAGSGTQRLTRIVGPARAMELLFTAAVIGADRAAQWGLVNWVVTDVSALDEARRVARVINSRGPVSNRLAKRLTSAALDVPIDAGLSHAVMAQQQIFETSDLHEGAASFCEKREPRFFGA